MSVDEMVRVAQPGHERHNQHGIVIRRCSETYTVEFCDHENGRTRYRIENFEGRALRAVIRQRVRV